MTSQRQVIENTALRLLQAEQQAIISHQWADTNVRQMALNSSIAAFQAAKKTLDTLDGLLASPNAQPVLQPYVDSFQALIVYILKAAKNPQLRLACLKQTADRAASKWEDLKAKADSASDVEDEIREMLADVKDATETAHDFLTKAGDISFISRRKVLYSSRLKRFLTSSAPASAAAESSEALGTELSEIADGVFRRKPSESPKLKRGLDIFGKVLFGLTLGLAVWNVIDDHTNTERAFITNTVAIAAGEVVGVAVEGLVEKAVTGLVEAGLIGSETSAAALLAPTVIGFIVVTAVSALIDLFFSIFWSDPVFPARLKIRLSVPLETSLRAQLTRPLDTTLTASLNASLS